MAGVVEDNDVPFGGFIYQIFLHRVENSLTRGLTVRQDFHRRLVPRETELGAYKQFLHCFYIFDRPLEGGPGGQVPAADFRFKSAWFLDFQLRV